MTLTNQTIHPRQLPPLRNRYFFIADVLLMGLAVLISFLLRLDPSGLRPYARTIIIFAALAALVKPAIFYLYGLYRRSCSHHIQRRPKYLAIWRLRPTLLVG